MARVAVVTTEPAALPADDLNRREVVQRQTGPPGARPAARTRVAGCTEHHQDQRGGGTHDDRDQQATGDWVAVSMRTTTAEAIATQPVATPRVDPAVDSPP